ncbi:MAG: SPOR domain-containing protein [Alphaproteobacteria bacterium]
MTMHSETTRDFPSSQPPAYDHYGAQSERTYDSFNDLYEDFDDERNKAPFVVVGALLAVAIIGGGLAFAYKQGASSGARGPEIVKADTVPVKVAPDQPGGLKIPFQDKAIFNTINGGAGAQAKQGRGAEPSALSPSANGAQPPLTIGALANRTTGGAGVAQPAAPTMAQPPLAAPSQGENLLNSGATQVAALPKPLVPNALVPNSVSGAELSPRRVETVTILPNGTILQPGGPQISGRQPSTSLSPGVLQPAPALPVASSPLQLPTLPNVTGPEVTPVGVAVAPAPAQIRQSGTSSLVPSPRPKPRPTTLARAAPTLRPAQATQAGQYAVQVASHRRQAEALSKFADMQRRYPSLLANYQPLIQRADLGTRGIFYRLRVGPVASKSGATQLCADLRRAGVSGCIVRPL